MTITLNRTETEPLPATRSDADAVLGVLHGAVVAVSDLDPDLLHSHTSAGQAVVTLAGAARAAAAALGAEPGADLGTAPGVVVVRELVAAASLLERAAARPGGPADPRALRTDTSRAIAAYGRFVLSAPAAT